jgi:hypothetical protein
VIYINTVLHQHLVFLMEDACHGHHLVSIIVGLGVRLVFEEIRVEELVVKTGNGRNIVV